MGERVPYDYYPTPLPLATAALELLPVTKPYNMVLDPGAGSGIWGMAWHIAGLGPAEITGVDIRNINPPLFTGSPYPDVYKKWYNNVDFLSGITISPYSDRYDFIIGNPPYALAEKFIRQSFMVAAPGAYILFLLRLEFLASQERTHGLWRTHKPLAVYPVAPRPGCQEDKPNGTGKHDFAIYLWQEGNTFNDPVIKWLLWEREL